MAPQAGPAVPGTGAGGELNELICRNGGDLAPAYTFDARAVLKGAELMGLHLKMFTDKKELTGKDGAPLQQEYGVLVVPAKVSVAEWMEQARNLRKGRK